MRVVNIRPTENEIDNQNRYVNSLPLDKRHTAIKKIEKSRRSVRKIYYPTARRFIIALNWLHKRGLLCNTELDVTIPDTEISPTKIKTFYELATVARDKMYFSEETLIFYFKVKRRITRLSVFEELGT
jgi:hypothetical protein